MEKVLGEAGLSEVWKKIKERSLPVKKTTKEVYESMSDREKEGLWIVEDENPSINQNINLYSDREVCIGTWFGKPLYRVAGRTICHPDRTNAATTFFSLPSGCTPIKYDIFMKGGTIYPKLPVIIGGNIALYGYYAHSTSGHIGLNAVAMIESYLVDLDLTYIIEYVKDEE